MTKEKIGLGIVTYKRPEYFKKIFSSVPLGVVDEIVVVNDGTPYDQKIDVPLIQHETNKGVGISKNDAFRHLLNKGCDYIFLMEDDIIIKNPEVFQAYIDAYKKTGIHHFNYSQHGLMNKYPNTNTPAPRNIVEYSKDTQIALYMHCVGAFCFYTRKCLEEIGLIDEAFYNASEHLEHTFRIINANMHPPFWWFADLKNSNSYLADIPWTRESSTISSNPNHNKTVNDSYNHFKKIYKHGILEIPNTPLSVVQSKLKEIYKNK